jgi:hypothetical protein
LDLHVRSRAFSRPLNTPAAVLPSPFASCFFPCATFFDTHFHRLLLLPLLCCSTRRSTSECRRGTSTLLRMLAVLVYDAARHGGTPRVLVVEQGRRRGAAPAVPCVPGAAPALLSHRRSEGGRHCRPRRRLERAREFRVQAGSAADHHTSVTPSPPLRVFSLSSKSSR